MALNSEYPNKLSQALNDLREQKQLCDVIINVGGRAFHAHKAVLAASGRYFLAMFTSGFQECVKSEVKIDGSVDVFEILLQFVYTGQLNITPKTAHDVLDMACYMQLTDVFKPFSTFVGDYLATKSNEMSVGDVFKIYNLAENHDQADLVKSSKKYLEDNVKQLKETEVFLENASVAFLEKFLSREEQVDILEMFVAWLKHDWENRCVHTLRLFQKVRLGLVPTENLKDLVDDEILAIPECKALLDHVFKLQSKKSTRSTIITAPICWYGKDYCRFQYYSAEEEEWKDLKRFASIPKSTKNHSMVVVDGLLYALGGTESLGGNSESKTDFFCYDPLENTWTELPSMNKGRKRCPVVYLDGFIYAISSQEAMPILRDVERYDIALKKWQILAPLPANLDTISAGAFKGKILVYGYISESQSSSVIKHAIYVYNPSIDTWYIPPLYENYSPLSVPESDHGALFIHGDACYKITYLDTMAFERPPTVNKVELEVKGGGISLDIGEEVDQDYVPDEEMGGSFRIGNEVFINHRGFVYNTGIKIAPDQRDTVDLDSLRNSFLLCYTSDQSNIICFTFDPKQVV